MSAPRQYLLAVHGAEGEPPPSPEAAQRAYAAVDALNVRLRDSGSWVFAGGLHPPDIASVVSAAGGRVTITDGPFAESREYLGGIWIILAEDLDQALVWAAEATTACGRPVEVRPFQTPLDG